MRLPFTKKTETPQQDRVEDIASAVLLQYLQHWGQTKEERGEALIKAGRWCGFDCQLEVVDGQVIPQVGGATTEESAENLRLWKGFRAAIEGCWPRGSWEGEHAAIVGVLRKFESATGRSAE